MLDDEAEAGIFAITEEDLEEAWERTRKYIEDMGEDPEKLLKQAADNLVYWAEWNEEFENVHGRRATPEELYEAAGGESGTFSEYMRKWVTFEE